MPKTAVAIRHVHFEDLGAFASELEAADYSIHYLEAGLDDLASVRGEEVDLLVVLGGPIGACDEVIYPFLKDEVALLEQRLAARRPTLGICLGAQLMARALGARVYAGPAREIGWKPVTLTDAGRIGPLRHLDPGPVLHWHGDTFDLPDEAQRLASTDDCLNQAFAIGNHALAFQFHPEADGSGFERWLVGHAIEITATGLSVAVLRADTARFATIAATNGQRCIREWLGGL
jgi:GMP synthase (glutamine-hydrolysing)